MAAVRIFGILGALKKLKKKLENVWNLNSAFRKYNNNDDDDNSVNCDDNDDSNNNNRTLTTTLMILRFAGIEPKGFEPSRYDFIACKITLQSMTHTHKHTHINDIRFYGWNTNLN
jgi:hypothetical protein